MSLTKEQEHEIQEAFSLFDQDRNGTIEPSELRIAMKALGIESSKAEIDRLLDEASSSDSLSFDEFHSIMAKKLSERDPHEEMEKAFQLFDIDQDGLISLSDMKKIAQELGETLPDDELESMIEEADVDGDGQLTLSDWIKVMERTSLYS
ncbi:hypothetical protein P9112_009780 [Eukaryota sp. TZLM1-RC]